MFFRLKFLFLMLFISLCLSCSNSIFNVMDYNTFSVFRSSSNSSGLSSDLIRATAVKETENLIVYIENGKKYSYQNLVYVCEEFEKYYEEEKMIYGTHTDVDKNGKIVILFLELNPNKNSGSILNGYFNPADLIKDQGNNADMLYMDLDGLNDNPDYMAGTILHELQHLINYNVNVFINNKEMDVWLNEALSESTSVLFSEATVQSRNAEFNNINYYCFYTWDLPISIFANYPSASVFMNWLYLNGGKNSDIFKNIAFSKENESYKKVLSTISSFSSWDELLLKWIEDINSGVINGAKINKIKNNINASIPLYPGALFVYNSSAAASSDINFSSSFIKTKKSGDYTIVLNANTYLGSNPNYVDVKLSYNNNQSSMLLKSVRNNDYTDVINIVEPKFRNILLELNK